MSADEPLGSSSLSKLTTEVCASWPMDLLIGKPMPSAIWARYWVSIKNGMHLIQPG